MGDQKDRMLRGELYLADDPELVADRQRCRLLVERFNATGVTDRQQREELLRTLLGHLGESTEINPPLQCDYGYPISVGARSFINYGAILLDCAPVTIGDDVQIATAVQLLTATHPAGCRGPAKPLRIRQADLDRRWRVAGRRRDCLSWRQHRAGHRGRRGQCRHPRPATRGVLAAGNPCRVVREL
jgi:maltose O-acetyltransferase